AQHGSGFIGAWADMPLLEFFLEMYFIHSDMLLPLCSHATLKSSRYFSRAKVRILIREIKRGILPVSGLSVFVKPFKPVRLILTFFYLVVTCCLRPVYQLLTSPLLLAYLFLTCSLP